MVDIAEAEGKLFIFFRHLQFRLVVQTEIAANCLYKM